MDVLGGRYPYHADFMKHVRQAAVVFSRVFTDGSMKFQHPDKHINAQFALVVSLNAYVNAKTCIWYRCDGEYVVFSVQNRSYGSKSLTGKGNGFFWDKFCHASLMSCQCAKLSAAIRPDNPPILSPSQTF